MDAPMGVDDPLTRPAIVDEIMALMMEREALIEVGVNPVTLLDPALLLGSE